MSLENKKGVDVSYANGTVNYNSLKKNGFEFVMIRCGYGSDSKDQDDWEFVNNVINAEKAGIPWGTYLFSYALSKSDALSEVEHVHRLLQTVKSKGYKPLLPVAIDIEPSDYVINNGGWNYNNLNTVATTFLEGVKAKGYYPMIYTGYEELDNYLSDNIRKNYDCWFAQWNSSPNSYKYNRLCIWQYGGETNYLRSPYIDGAIFDQNICYKDYPTIIKNGGYNGWPKSVTPTPKKNKKPIEMIAFEVLDGVWGEGDERKKELTLAGYDYDKVQARVNEIVASWNNPTLDTKGYKLGDSNIAILAIKETLITAKKLGIITQGVQEDKGFGDGTLIAVNQILAKGKYNQNGIMGENFVKYLSKLIKEKLSK